MADGRPSVVSAEIDPALEAAVFWNVVETGGTAVYMIADDLDQDLVTTVHALQGLATRDAVQERETSGLITLSPDRDAQIQAFAEILPVTSGDKLVDLLEIQRYSHWTRSVLVRA